METYQSTAEKLYELQFYNNLMWENTTLQQVINQLEQKTMRNQFFYTMEYQVAPAAGDAAGAKPITMRRMASFNIDKVIRSVETEEGKLIVILDDFHEETKQVIVHNSNGKPIPKMETQMLQSEIHLNVEDKERFKALTNIPENTFLYTNEPTLSTTNGI
jgi:hypothetical protein